jgi:hypothetical protein
MSDELRQELFKINDLVPNGHERQQIHTQSIAPSFKDLLVEVLVQAVERGVLPTPRIGGAYRGLSSAGALRLRTLLGPGL